MSSAEYSYTTPTINHTTPKTHIKALKKANVQLYKICPPSINISFSGT